MMYVVRDSTGLPYNTYTDPTVASISLQPKNTKRKLIVESLKLFNPNGVNNTCYGNQKRENSSLSFPTCPSATLSTYSASAIYKGEAPIILRFAVPESLL